MRHYCCVLLLVCVAGCGQAESKQISKTDSADATINSLKTELKQCHLELIKLSTEWQQSYEAAAKSHCEYISSEALNNIEREGKALMFNISLLEPSEQSKLEYALQRLRSGTETARDIETIVYTGMPLLCEQSSGKTVDYYANKHNLRPATVDLIRQLEDKHNASFEKGKSDIAKYKSKYDGVLALINARKKAAEEYMQKNSAKYGF